MADHPRDDDSNNAEGGGEGRRLSLRLPGAPEPLGPPPARAAFPQQQQQQQQPPLSFGSSSAVVVANNNQAMLRQQAPSQVTSQQQQPGLAAAPSGYRSPFGGNNIIIHRGGGGADDYVPALHRQNVNAIHNNNADAAAAAVAVVAADLDADPEEHNGFEEETMHRATAGWAEVEPTNGIPPSARSLHSAALFNGVMYVFGGYDGSQRVNSFHGYSFAEKRWSPVVPSSNSRPPPSPRDRHASVAYANSFYVHGGFDGTSRDPSLFAFDFSTMAWREVIAAQGRPPSARHSHAAVVHGHSMYVFGGYDGSYKSDLHEFDFTLSRWNAVSATGRRPRARYRATCTVYKNWMILYGGHDGTRHLSDTFLFDFETKTWSSLVTEGIPPIPRDSHVSVVHGNSMYVFGGSSGSAMNDLHELQLPPDLTTATKWRPVNTSRADQPRHRFCHVAVAYNDSMYVFGGYDGAERLNSFIKFDFAVYDLSFEIPPATIISDFRCLVNNDTFSDITFIVEGRSVFAHKLMLMRCSYFEALFLGQMREAHMDTIHIEQVQYDVFLLVLEYLYTDQIVISFSNAMELFEAADLFCIHRLKTMCEKRMLEQITVDNAAGIFHAADVHSATALRQKAKKYILSHWDDVSKSSCFEEMGRSNIELVFELLKSR